MVSANRHCSEKWVWVWCLLHVTRCRFSEDGELAKRSQWVRGRTKIKVRIRASLTPSHPWLWDCTCSSLSEVGKLSRTTQNHWQVWGDLLLELLSEASLPWSWSLEHPLGTTGLTETQALGLHLTPPSVPSPPELSLWSPMSMGPLVPRPGVCGAPPPTQHCQSPPSSFPSPVVAEGGNRVLWTERQTESKGLVLRSTTAAFLCDLGGKSHIFQSRFSWDISEGPLSSLGKESACNAEGPGLISGSGRSPWRRKWQPTPVFLPGESRRQRSLAGYSPWDRKSQTRLSD